MRDIPEFEMGFVTDGVGAPIDDTAVAFSNFAGIERELRLEGDGAINLMPIIVAALNTYDEMTAALRCVVAAMDEAGTTELKRPSACSVSAGALKDLLAKAEAA